MTNGFPYLLLADDDPDDRELFCAAMHRFYPQVGIHTFQDGDELMDFLDNCPGSTLPACMLIDYKMPRLTAPQILQLTGADTRYACIPKVVWSTSERQQDIDECLGLGAVRFAIKPDKDAKLYELIRSLNQWLIKSALTVTY